MRWRSRAAPRGRSSSRRLKRDKVTLIAGAITGLFLLAALLSPLLDAMGVLDPYGTNPKLVTGVGSLPTGPLGGMSIDHWMGVEPGTGRDILSGSSPASPRR